MPRWDEILDITSVESVAKALARYHHVTIETEGVKQMFNEKDSWLGDKENEWKATNNSFILLMNIPARTEVDRDGRRTVTYLLSEKRKSHRLSRQERAASSIRPAPYHTPYPPSCLYPQLF